MVLSLAYSALCRRPFSRASLANADIGTLLGMMNSDNVQRIPQIPGPYDMTGNGISAAGSRLSFVFAMRGPCVALDTACSSSLVAVHLALRFIDHRDCDDAISMGVNLILTPAGAFTMFAVAGMLSTLG